MDQLAKQFADLAAQYGPSVAEAAKAAAQTEACSSLVYSLITAGIAVAALFAARFLWAKAATFSGSYSGNDDLLHVASAVLYVVSFVTFLIAAWTWLDPWTWTAIYHPELWIAKQALHI